jgi:hypothetical protein
MKESGFGLFYLLQAYFPAGAEERHEKNAV